MATRNTKGWSTKSLSEPYATFYKATLKLVGPRTAMTTEHNLRHWTASTDMHQCVFQISNTCHGMTNHPHNGGITFDGLINRAYCVRATTALQCVLRTIARPCCADHTGMCALPTMAWSSLFVGVDCFGGGMCLACLPWRSTSGNSHGRTTGANTRGGH